MDPVKASLLKHKPTKNYVQIISWYSKWMFESGLYAAKYLALVNKKNGLG